MQTYRITAEAILCRKPIAPPMLFLADSVRNHRVQVTRQTIGRNESDQKSQQVDYLFSDKESTSKPFSTLEELAKVYWKQNYQGPVVKAIDLIGFDLDETQGEVLSRAFILAQSSGPVAVGSYLEGWIEAAYQYGQLSTRQYLSEDFHEAKAFVALVLRNLKQSFTNLQNHINNG